MTLRWAENGDTDSKVLALPSELGNPHSFVNERQQKRHFGIAARALTNTLQSGSSQTNKAPQINKGINLRSAVERC